ncbi:hypothetical protein Tco_1150305 [Tanacetum coccineum]
MIIWQRHWDMVIIILGIAGIKSLLNAASITAAHIKVNAAQLYEAIHKELGDSLVRAATTTSSLEALNGILNRRVKKRKRKEVQELISERLYKVGLDCYWVESLLELLDEKLSQKDVNQKLLRSLSPEWNTYVVVWRNKFDLDTMSMDDLYNNLKVYEPKVKGMSSSSSSTQNIGFVSSSNNNTSSTNEAVNTAHGVSTTSTQVNVANFTNIDNLSDAIICSFFASQPNSPQLVHEDL